MKVTPTATCRVCHADKAIDDYYPDRNRALGRMTACKECTKRAALERYRAKNPDAAVRGPRPTLAMTPDERKAALRRSVNERRARARALDPLLTIPCATCGTVIKQKTKRNRYCSTACKDADAPPQTVTGNCIDCGIEYTKWRSHGYDATRCKPCQRVIAQAKRRVTLEQRRLADPDRAIDHRHRSDRKRALRFGVDYEYINRIKVYRRDNWTCGICAEPIHPDCAYPSKDSASLDHVIPISRGGPHLYSNVQAAHLGCNIAKSDRMDEPLAA